VDDSLRGTGVGKALVERLVDDARGEQLKIVPRCSFVKALFQRHREWSDVMDS
jgi:predicted GNAT family acetyltransferase